MKLDDYEFETTFATFPSPVLSIIKVGCVYGGLLMILNHDMGSSACILTQNSYYTEKLINEADVDIVSVNVGVCAPHPYLPFGGKKGSLVGNIKMQDKNVIDSFTQRKVASMQVVNPKGNDSSGTKPANSNVRSCVGS